MSGRSFRSVFMVASCAGAALGCYLVSLRVASERAALESVETRIVLAQRDLRVLQTEIGTRGRLSQPAADQFLKGGFELARLARPEHQVDFKAPVVLASAPAPQKPQLVGQPEVDDSGAPTLTSEPRTLLHVASFKTETREVPARPVVALPQTTAKSMDKPAAADRPASPRSMVKPGLAAAHQPVAKQPTSVAAPAKKSVDKAAAAPAKAVTKPVRIAKVDPLAPLPVRHSGTSKGSTADR
jgi:hypothetical protein